MRQYARVLREDGLLTTGARGVNAPDMTALDAARMTIAVLATPSPLESPALVRRYGGFPEGKAGEGGVMDEVFELPSGHTLEQLLSRIFQTSPAAVVDVSHYEWLGNFAVRYNEFEVLYHDRDARERYLQLGAELAADLEARPSSDDAILEEKRRERHELFGVLHPSGGTAMRITRAVTSVEILKISRAMFSDESASAQPGSIVARQTGPSDGDFS